MAYESRHPRRQKILYNNANDSYPLEAQLTIDGAKVTPTSCTVDIYIAGNSTALVSAGVATVSGTVVTYAVDTTTTASWPIGSSYRADFNFVYGGNTYPVVVVFDVVRRIFELPVGSDQLVAADPKLEGADWAGDNDFSELIETCRGHFQIMLESKAVESGRLFEDMILDSQALSPAFIQYILYYYYATHARDEDRADAHKMLFDSLFKSFMGGAFIDSDQDGFEEQEQSVQRITLRV